MKKKIEEDRKKRIEKLIKEKISHIPIKGDYDGTHALYLNDGAISGLADALCKEVVFKDEKRFSEWQIETILRNNSIVVSGHNLIIEENKFLNICKEIKELSSPTS